MAEEDRWIKLEQVVEKILRKVLKEELAVLGKDKSKIGLLNGKWTGITTGQREVWAAAFGAVDLDVELARAASWIVSNPSLAPKSQMSRFLNTWFTREQNKRSLQSIPVSRPAQIQTKTCSYCPKVSVGSCNGYEHCSEHSMSAMDGVRPMGMVRRM